VENEIHIKPNLLELESLRSELIEKTFNTSSNNLRLFLYQHYFEKILSLNNPNFEEAFLKEFLDGYISCISKFEGIGVEPEISKKLLEQLKILSQLNIASESLTAFNSEINRIERQIEKLTLILEAKDIEDGETHKAFFPLIDRDAPTGFYGIIDSISIRISKSADADKFIIVPSEKEIEKKIFEQCKKSWFVAIELSKKFIKKTSKHHEVIISFDKKEGLYEGNSLGIALTISFLERLLKIYNPVYIINIKEQSAFTGGVTETGEVLCTSEEIIKRKVAAIFFSETTTFVFPKCEETYAYFALTQLKKSYPDRKLKLVPAEDITDVLNRRDIVDIKKQKVIVRTGKFVKKNWISAVATVLLAILFAYLFVMDFDDNPTSFITDGQSIFFKNKNGKILWKKDFKLSIKYIDSPNYLKGLVKIVNIDSDEQNEVLFAQLDDGPFSEKGSSDIKCYTAKGELIWRYSFADTISSMREKMLPYYGLIIIDTLSVNGVKNLFVRANNSQSFSSAIFRINLETGERLPGTFWCSGHTYAGIIKDINNDEKKDILCVGLDNGYEDAVFFGYEIDTLTKVRLSTDEYLIRGHKISDLITYIRFPKTDYDEYKKFRTPGIAGESFKDFKGSRFYQFYTSDYLNNYCSCLWYQVDYNLKDVNIIIDSRFRVMRDSLVSHGALPLPNTDTPEYVDIQKNRILYLKNSKWVKRKELD
jgi:hypothetical protein